MKALVAIAEHVEDPFRMTCLEALAEIGKSIMFVRIPRIRSDWLDSSY